jgi:DNA-binding response OmpR family regulator
MFPANPMKMKVLIIDDEAEIGNLLSSVLGSMGFKAEYQPDLRSGISSFEANMHDIVFLDLRLPDGDGLSLIPRIKEAKSDAAIIVISAHGGLDEKVKAEMWGAKYYLQKPFNSAQIRHALQN